MAKIVIVGAGLCGLWLARQLMESGRQDVLLLEKSRGVGGRIATRRTQDAKFDHGAQFYSASRRLQALHERWLSEGLAHPYFEKNSVARMMSRDGMTALAKNLATGLEIRFEHLVEKISQTETGWYIQCAGALNLQADCLVLTCPLPQALLLLDQSQIKYDSSLLQIQYASALVGLFEGVTYTAAPGYVEPEDGHIFSIADQYSKGVSKTPACTVTMKPAFSAEFFNDRDMEVLELMSSEVKALDPGFTFSSASLKRWRYSHPLPVVQKGADLANRLYAQPSANLYLAGDAFGGPSLGGGRK